jgi:hypothetical protein
MSAHLRVTSSDLQNSPAVLIGLRNNCWTASLAGSVRFTVERTAPNTLVLRDKKNPPRNDRSVDLSTPHDQPTRDCALVARELDPKTGQIVVTVGAITRHGTLAASEFITNPEQIGKLDAYGTKSWEHKNGAIVLSTEVIRGGPGSAKIVAVDFWQRGDARSVARLGRHGFSRGSGCSDRSRTGPCRSQIQAIRGLEPHRCRMKGG